jgi:hypothetical protein
VQLIDGGTQNGYKKCMSLNPGYSPALTHQIVTEMQALRDATPFEATTDIDTVWVLSAPGTYYQEATDGVYTGPFDRNNIEVGIHVVRDVTALRLGKDEAVVTEDDVAEYGPLFYYNGESASTPGNKYPQNQDLERAIARGDFPLPASRVLIRDILTANTPGQIIDMAAYCRAQAESPDGQVPHHVAIVGLSPHLPRVGRYLEKYRDDYPDGIDFRRVPVPVEKHGVGAAVRETKRIMQYLAAGHLAATSLFERS